MTFHRKWKNPSCTPTYGSWVSMRKRCLNPKNKNYKLYGGRGITVCERWINDYDAFFDDMGEKPSKKHSLDRINNAGNYEPSNCRWATQLEQCNNTSKNVFIKLNSKELTASQWARELDLPPQLIIQRVAKGFSAEEVLSKFSLKKWEHGKVAAYYKYKCRCSICIEGEKQRRKNRKTNNTSKKIPRLEDIHGTPIAYSHYKCRCDECLDGYDYRTMKKRQYNKEYYKRK